MSNTRNKNESHVFAGRRSESWTHCGRSIYNGMALRYHVTDWEKSKSRKRRLARVGNIYRHAMSFRTRTSPRYVRFRYQQFWILLVFIHLKMLWLFHKVKFKTEIRKNSWKCFTLLTDYLFARYEWDLLIKNTDWRVSSSGIWHRAVRQLPTCLLPGFCWTYFFDTEDGGDMYLRNVGLNSTDYTASYSRRWYSS
jgi:hypothetical protein